MSAIETNTSGGFRFHFPQRLAINRNGLSCQLQLQLGDPFPKTLLKTLRVESDEYSPNCVVRRNAIGQLKKLSEPCDVSSRKPFDVSPRVRPADRAAKHNADQIKQVMISTTVLPRVCQIDKVCKKFKVPVLLRR